LSNVVQRSKHMISNIAFTC